MLFPTSIQYFPRLIEDGFVYVDKTALIYQLTHTKTCCFLSRPRRFGKSLLVSTMEAYFKGRRELFKGLAIEDLEKEWNEYPVIHLDLNNGDFHSKESLEKHLQFQLNRIEEDWDLSPIEVSLGNRFEALINRISENTGKKVVVLIDEYDKPMLEIITDDKAQEEYRNVLKPFYGTLKKTEQYLRFVFITGVTKFAKLSVFSDLNQLDDISLMPEYGTICGITKEEMLNIFQDPIKEFAEEEEVSYEEMVTLLENKYDGYHFSRKLVDVFNPFSLLNAFDKKDLANYWFGTGTPTFLVKLLKDHHYLLSDLSGAKANGDLLTSIESTRESPLPVIFQSGYLTIKEYDKKSRIFTLDYPNEEVKKGFLNFLLPRYASLRGIHSDAEITKLIDELSSGDCEAFLRRIRSFLSDHNYDVILDCEAHFQNVLYIVFSLLGMQVEVEKRISNGRIDMVVKMNHYIYVMEFKYDGSVQDAMKQIKEKEYALPYQRDKRKVILVAVNFDSKTRNIDSNWIIEEYSN